MQPVSGSTSVSLQTARCDLKVTPFFKKKEKPCHKAGSKGKKHADEMLFWTKQEFQTFIEVMKDRTENAQEQPHHSYP